MEFWRVPANGIGDASTQLTTDGDGAALGRPALAGRHASIAHHDKDQQLWVFDVAKKRRPNWRLPSNIEATSTTSPGRRTAAGSPTPRPTRTRSRASTCGTAATGTHRAGDHRPLRQRTARRGAATASGSTSSPTATSTRSCGSPWGSRQPEPFFDKQTRIYHVGAGTRRALAVQPADELHPPEKDDKKKTTTKEAEERRTGRRTNRRRTDQKTDDGQGHDAAGTSRFRSTSPASRRGSIEVPVPAGQLQQPRRWTPSACTSSTRDAEPHSKRDAQDAGRSTTTSPSSTTFLGRRQGLRAVGRRQEAADAAREGLPRARRRRQGAGAPSWRKQGAAVGDWPFRLDPREEWRQMFTEAWRLERDYFYDRDMHGVDWPAMRDEVRAAGGSRHRPRRALRRARADGQRAVGAAHLRLRRRRAERDGRRRARVARRARSTAIERAAAIASRTSTDRSRPARRAVAAARGPASSVKDGDVITQINGVADAERARSRPAAARPGRQAGAAARVQTAGQRPGAGGRRDPIAVDARRRPALRRVGIHAPARGRAREPEQHRLRAPARDGQRRTSPSGRATSTRSSTAHGLIIDVRHNRGGNIDSWMLGRLLRKAWFYWQPRVGQPSLEHAVRLPRPRRGAVQRVHGVGRRGVRRGLPAARPGQGDRHPHLGRRDLAARRATCWSTAASRRRPEFGVYGPEGAWLIEGHGVEPDIVVDNLPHATFDGKDAQLERGDRAPAGADSSTKPVPVPPAPPYPIKRYVPPARPAGQ